MPHIHAGDDSFYGKPQATESFSPCCSNVMPSDFWVGQACRLPPPLQILTNRTDEPSTLVGWLVGCKPVKTSLHVRAQDVVWRLALNKWVTCNSQHDVAVHQLRTLWCQHANSMIIAVADVDAACGIHENSVRSIHATLERISVRAIRFFAISDDGFDSACCGSNNANGVAFRVGEIDVSVCA